MTLVGPRLDWRRHLRSPLLIALVLSVLLHVYIWLMAHLISAALKNGWLPPWIQRVVQPVAALVDPPKPTVPPEARPQESWQEIPLQFVEVDPLVATDQAPPDAKLYSTANTVAANPDPPKVEQLVPRIDGQREDTLKTFDTTQPSPTPPPPTPKESVEATAPPAPPVEERPKVVARTPQKTVEAAAPPTGETQLAKADPKTLTPDLRERLEPKPQQEEQREQPAQEAVKPRRPKTLAEVRASKGALVGERMKQEGGVHRPALQSSLNVKASPLGDYNYRMVLAVQEQWYLYLQERRFSLERQGKVVITFDLHSDGSITNVATKDSNVGETLSFLCEMSVMKPAPFGKWPADVRRLIGGDIIPVTFTFNYY